MHGITSVLLGHPFDTVKTRLQAAHSTAVVSSTGLSPLIYNTRSGFVLMYRMAYHEGIGSLYRGMTPPLIGLAAKRTVEFAIFERMRELLGRLVRTNEAVAAPQHHSGVGSFLAGSVAGGCGAVVIGCPLHVIKIQAQNAKRGDIKNSWDCAKHIAREDGWRGFYRGLGMHVIKDMLFAGMYLGLYDNLKALAHRNSADTGKGTVLWKVMASGMTASVLTWIFLFPFDTIKTAIQAKSFASVQAMFVGHAKERNRSLLARLYVGMPSAVTRAGPVSAVAMGVYEETKKICAKPS
jgi:hypothetical protein